MTLNELYQTFELYEKEYRCFEKIENPRHQRPDIYAFLILHDLEPSSSDIVGAAEHDIIYINVDPHIIAEKITNDLILILVRCGVNLNVEGFYMNT